MAVKKSDLISGSAVTLTGLIFFLSTIGIKPVKRGLSPADFPRLITIAMMICGVALIIKSLFTKQKVSDGRIDPDFVKKFIALIVLFAVYVLLLDVIGFLWLTPFFVFSAAYIFGMKRFFLNIVVSIGTTFLVYYIFSEIFKVPLPHFSF